MIYDKWLSQILKINSYILNRFDDRIFNKVRKTKGFYTAKISIDNLKIAKKLQDNKFILSDINLIFFKKIIKNNKNNSRIFLLKKNNFSELLSMQKNLFINSRFYKDKKITVKNANKIKYEWVKNSYFKKECKVFIQKGSKINGFCLTRESKMNIIIDLIGVKKIFRGKVIGKILLENINNFYSNKKYKKIIAGTQMSNFSSIQMYIKAGFRLSEIKYIYHFHNY